MEPPRNAVRRSIAFAVIVTSLVTVSLFAGLFVAAPVARATPWTGAEPTPTDLGFYLHNSSTPIMVGATGYLTIMSTVNDTTAPWAGKGGVSVASHYDTVNFVAAPQFAAPLALNGSVSADVYMNQNGSSLSAGSITLTVNELTPTGVPTLLGAGTPVSTSAIGAGGSIPNVVALPGPILNTTIPTGDTLQVVVSISGSSSTTYGIWWGSVNGTTYPSVVDFSASSYLTVASVAVLNSTGAPVSTLTHTAFNESLTIRAVVADPLGAYDFEARGVYFTIFNSTGVAVYGPVAMTAVPSLALPGDPNGSYAVGFNYSGLGTGQYNFTVNATDNTEGNTLGQNTLPTYFGRVATLSVPISVGLPPVPVVVRTLDDHGMPLSGAIVRVWSGGSLFNLGTTNALGEVNFSLANQSAFTFKVVWQGIAVGSFPRTIASAGEEFNLTTAVIYPTFELLTAVGSYPLAYALVDVIHPNGTELSLVVANAAGRFTLDQVPVGNYTLTVVFADSEVVSARSVYATSDGPYPVTAGNVFALTILTTTSSGGSLSGVFVEVVNTTTGASVDSGITDGAGELTFLVPRGTYNVSGDWSVTYDLTPLSQEVRTTVSVTGPQSTTLSFSKAYPAFTSTYEFYIILGFAAMAAVIAILAVLLARRPRREPATPLTPAPPISPAEGVEGKDGPKSK